MRALLVLCALLWGSVAMAVEPDEVLADPALEARARAISADLRCLVCRNESIDESHAGLARDLRLLVRERLVAGDTDPEVMDFVVDRYGEYVLLRPRLGGSNLFLWLAGPLMLLIAGGGAWAYLRARAKAEAPVAALNADEQARLRELLGDSGSTSDGESRAARTETGMGETGNGEAGSQ